MKLSIITINYNNLADLKKTIESVFEQTWNDYEYIVIDGGSTDGSLELINSYDNRLSYWVSEPDAGVFHAMNKGIIRAEGDYLLMLNAGDLLCGNEVLYKVFAEKNYREDVLVGDVYRAIKGKIFEKSYFPNVFTFDFFRKGSLSHQGTFIKRSLHNIIGLYDENLKYASDWKFFTLAICKYNISYKHLSLFIAICDCGGLTSDAKNFPAMAQESTAVLKEHFPSFINDYVDYDNIRSKIFEIRVSNVFPTIKKNLKKLKCFIIEN